MIIKLLRAAIQAVGGSPSQFMEKDLLRSYVTQLGGSPTSFNRIGLLRQAIIASGGTPSGYRYSSLLRQLVTARGGTPSGYDVNKLWQQLGGGIVVVAPTNSGIPTITGTAQEGLTLTSSNGSWANAPTSYTRQWKRGGVNISGATGTTYQLVNGDVGSTITVTVTATNSAGSASATSLATATVIAAASGTHTDPDLNAAKAFQDYTLAFDTGSGDRGAQLYAAFPSLKTFLDVGHSGTLAAGSTHPNWDATDQRVELTGSGTITVSGYDIQGRVSAGKTGAMTLSNCHIRAGTSDSSTPYRVEHTTNQQLTMDHVTIDTFGSGAFSPGTGPWTLTKSVIRYGNGDLIKANNQAVAKRIENAWTEAGGQQVGAHCDSIQLSDGGNLRAVNLCGFSQSTGTYDTNSDGVNAHYRIDATTLPGTAFVEKVDLFGGLSAMQANAPIDISAQKTVSVVRNVTIAYLTLAPSEMRPAGKTNWDQIAPTLTDGGGVYTSGNAGGGLLENIGFFGNKVFGYGVLKYADRAASHIEANAVDVTGIWHWNPATIDTATVALWKDLGLLNSGGTPATGMLRSVAGVITTQSKSTTAAGGTALNLDLSSVPDGATIKLHLPSPAYELEYVA